MAVFLPGASIREDGLSPTGGLSQTQLSNEHNHNSQHNLKYEDACTLTYSTYLIYLESDVSTPDRTSRTGEREIKMEADAHIK